MMLRFGQRDVVGAVGDLPALVLGDGPPLVLLAGLSPQAGLPTGPMRAAELAAVRPLTGQRQVWYVNRRPGLPDVLTMARLAELHATAIRAQFGGPVDVLGLSTGGSIAQQLAADAPDVVRRLVLVSTACRLGPAARKVQRRAGELVRAGQRRAAYAVMVTEAAAPGLPSGIRRAVGAVGGLAVPLLYPNAGDLLDFARTVEAEDGFDLARAAGPVRAPTLLIAGGRDRFYDMALFAETARLIPDCRLEVLPERGHVGVVSDPRFFELVLTFLDSV